MTAQTIYKCEHSFGGHVFDTKLFNTREEAESFMQQLAQVAPETSFTIAPVEMQAIWN